MCLEGGPCEGTARRWAFTSPRKRLQQKSTLLTALISDFQPPESWENKCLLFKPPNLKYFVMAARATQQNAKFLKYTRRFSLMPLPKGHHGHAGLFRRSWLNKEKESLPDVVRSNDFRLKRGFRKSGLSREPWLQGCCVLKPWRVAWDISVVSKHTLRKPAGLTTKLFLCSFLKPTFYT